ncbi:sensor histidine kinase [Rugosimonospora acidiphila]|uniref:histidine kinase n=1 Tax=Rugosimonospora acidiphila TaxID=556531 RepID=A0ABP9S5T8_9ACTN
MDPTPHVPRPPRRRLLPPAARTALVWTAVGLFPFVLILSLGTPTSRASIDLVVVKVPQIYALPILAMALPTTLLRRRPVLALTLTVFGAAAQVVAVHLPPWQAGYLSDVRVVQILAMDLAVGVVAATRPRRVSIAVAVGAVCVQIVIGFGNPNGVLLGRRPEVPMLAMAIAWMIGNSVRARRRYAEAAGSQAEIQAVTAERLRIARELHDLVAHSIGVIAIQAGVGSRVMDTQPAEARNALLTIEATSRETLAGLRRVVGGLRRTEAGERSGAGPLDPAPGLADLDRLVETTIGAGVSVDVTWLGDRRPVPGDIDLSAYRIIQEAVTNVVRHAGTPRCRVTVDYRGEELAIEITDDGRGCPVPATGYGITGMRERVGLLHGGFSAEPRAEGGFRVAATLPLPETVAAPARP